MEISGGKVTVNAQGDGLDSNGSLLISGGDTVVFGPTNDGNAAIDADGEFTVSGGTLLAVGSAGMAMAPGEASTQGWIAGVATAQAGSTVSVVDGQGQEPLSVMVPKEVASVVYSAPAVSAGGSYSVNVDGITAATLVEGETTFTGMRAGPVGEWAVVRQGIADRAEAVASALNISGYSVFL